ncbi:STAS/SEC14 domain-containing protein [Pseudoxanthomonas sp. PXM03]|jgi:hypothetical protein|uniref:STAS/SEC14 domain-containing protein n=1 Tax=Pseudoxanthomonas sp. PXM03 TaxID=2769284 RepID=UPI00177DE230|nr:STAS/SEC14 domain-containing protein [Pseudoxanthomonas sp. PXM03]MBD9436533.1 STAS/SEC14 domain-containing protein [Pseudoxanthomonas sp. PXM03]
MIEILSSPPHVAAYRFSDQLTGEDYDACIADIEMRLAQFPRIAVLGDISDLHGLSVDVIGKDLRYALAKRGEYARFARAAVVTDKRWLVAVTGVVDRLMPQTEMRTFAPEERVIALAWAAELDPSLV